MYNRDLVQAQNWFWDAVAAAAKSESIKKAIKKNNNELFPMPHWKQIIDLLELITVCALNCFESFVNSIIYYCT